MIINNLNYLEEVSEKTGLVGGIYAGTNTQTIAQPGFAYADANAVALGEQTSAVTQTSTSVQRKSTISISLAYAKADARAYTSNSRYLDQSESRSFYISNL